MPATDSPALIVARYLKSNNYTETYDAFLAEANLSYEAGDVTKGDLTIEALLEEKKTFDIATKFEKLGVEDAAAGWRLPAPSNSRIVDVLPSASNILSAKVEHFEDLNGASDPTMLVTTADRRVNVLDGRARILRASHTGLHDAPVLSCTKLGNAILTSSMSGSLHLNNLKGEFISKRRDHSKYVVRVAVLHDEGSETIIATAGWDSKILIYKCKSPFDALNLSEPVSAIPLQTKPEAIVFVRHPDNNQPLLLVSRTDASHIFYYTIEAEPRLLGKQNLAPHSNAWVAFTPSAMELSPTDPTLLAVGTSSVPHMKLLLVRLLFPPLNGEQDLPTPAPSALAALLDGPDAEQRETQSSQARAALALAEREAVAIQIHCTTMAPQTAYSTPAVAWRPDGSGVWVNGDDGAVRGVEASTGKVVSTLVGHDPGSKVRCLWAGNVKGREGEGDRELLVSGGFDHKLIVWEVDE